MLHGVLLIALFTCAAFYIGGMDWVKALSFSPMVRRWILSGEVCYTLFIRIVSLNYTVKTEYPCEK